MIDTNGDGRITRPWNEPGEAADPARDTRIPGFSYGIIANPLDGTAWVARTGPFPGRLLRLDRGDNPPESCIAEVYEPPSIENPAVDPARTGHAPRGIDVDRNGLIWTALSGSGHLASFDRSKCRTLNGPQATGQHCPEGWTLHPTPGPQMKGVSDSGSADFHYYNWVDQFDTLGLGANVPIATGSGSDSLLALLPETGEWVVLRVPYPLGFFARASTGASTTRTPAGRAAACGPTTARTSTGTSRAARAAAARSSSSSSARTRWRSEAYSPALSGSAVRSRTIPPGHGGRAPPAAPRSRAAPCRLIGR